MDKSMKHWRARSAVVIVLTMVLGVALLVWSEFSVASPWYGLMRSAREAAHLAALQAQATTGPFPGLIFSAAAAERLSQDKEDRFFPLAGPYWTPSADQVVQLERAFPAFIASERASACERL